MTNSEFIRENMEHVIVGDAIRGMPKFIHIGRKKYKLHHWQFHNDVSPEKCDEYIAYFRCISGKLIGYGPKGGTLCSFNSRNSDIVTMLKSMYNWLLDNRYM